MKLLRLCALLLVSVSANAADLISTSFFSNKAVSGYDTVAYFTQGQAVKGDSQWTTEYQGAQWLFSSAEHLAMFEAEPEKYAPQYGGYCAWAVSEKSDFAPSDPEQWAIVDGKLYLNYNADIKGRWDSARTLHIQQADQNWPGLIAQ